MRRLATVLGLALVLAGGAAADEALGFRFDSIDGGEIGFPDWEGRPVLVANTASLCRFAPQYAELQALFDAYGEKGLVVLAVPSDDFEQEYDTEQEVKDYCELNYGLDLPMTTISHVLGEEALPFYRWLAEAHGYAPEWNFEKVLVGVDGTLLGTWGSEESPLGPAITGAVEAALGS